MVIAEELGTLENHIVIEGHTDASFGGRKKYSNWELSADRANAARQLMDVSGLYDGQVREVRGFADRFPMITKDPKDHRNRRISLVVLYLSQESKQNQVEVGQDLMYDADNG
jgi:chemotaxis protein MotB